jgi:proteasome lid subunit RPN8/RPN11
LLRIFKKRSIILRGSKVEWHLPDELKSQAERAVDYVLAFLWTANEIAMDAFVKRYVCEFSRGPLQGYGVTRSLLMRLDSPERAKPNKDSDPVSARIHDCDVGASNDYRCHASEDTSNPPSVTENEVRPPFEPPAHSNKKFIIKEQTDPNNIVIQQKPPMDVLEPLTSLIETDSTLFVARDAALQIFDHISWGKSTTDNVHEQGGILVGLRSKTPNDDEFVVVTHALPATADTRSSTYVRFDHAAWSDILHRLDLLKEQDMAQPQAVIVGWYHTHPNWLDCFMSGTDLRTQRSVFHRPWNYALVLNPQRRLVACFVGAEARPCGAAVF